MESDIDGIIETYTMFMKFEIAIPQDDYDQAYSLKMNYDQMMQRSKEVSLQIFEMQAPLLVELNTGIKAFHEEMLTFNDDYETSGPMEPDLTAKEASDRVIYRISSVALFPFLNVYV